MHRQTRASVGVFHTHPGAAPCQGDLKRIARGKSGTVAYRDTGRRAYHGVAARQDLHRIKMGDRDLRRGQAPRGGIERAVQCAPLAFRQRRKPELVSAQVRQAQACRCDFGARTRTPYAQHRARAQPSAEFSEPPTLLGQML
jgi:hypothetical protein